MAIAVLAVVGERGVKEGMSRTRHPSGMALKLLAIVEKHGLQVLA